MIDISRSPYIWRMSVCSVGGVDLICSHHKLSPAAGDVTGGGGLLHPQGCTAQETRGRRSGDCSPCAAFPCIISCCPHCHIRHPGLSLWQNPTRSTSTWMFNPYYYVILLNKWWNKSIRWNMIKRWRWQNLSVQGEEWVPCLDCPVCIQMWIHKWSEKLCRWQCLTPRWAGQTKSTPPMVKHFTFQTFLCYSSHKQIMYVGHHELIILIIYLCNLYILDDNMDC